MGNCWSRRNANSNPHPGNYRNITVAVLGLDDAGKTVTAKVLKGDPPNEVVPTIGFTNLQFSFKKRNISMYDLGGGPRIRDIWRNYFGEVHGLIYVLDSSHRERLEECREVLMGVLDDMKIKGKPLLVLGNKQDIHGAMDTSEICDHLKLDALADTHQSLCRIECCSALKQEKGKADNAIISGFQWLLDMIDLHWVTLQARVDKDVADQKEHEKKARMEREERVRKLREEREKEAAKNAEDSQSENDGGDDFDEVDGDPFKPIDRFRFSTKDGLKMQETEPTPKSTTTHKTCSPPADVMEGENSSGKEHTDDKAANSQSRYHSEGNTGNGICGQILEPSRLPPVEPINPEQRKLTAVAPSILPPLDMATEHSEKKRRKRRNKRNRVVPVMPNINDEATEPSASGKCLDSKSNPTDHLDLTAVSTEHGCMATSANNFGMSKVTSWESNIPKDRATGNHSDGISFTEDLPTENDRDDALQTIMFARPNGDSEDVIS